MSEQARSVRLTKIRGTDGRIYYSYGNVGIGTDSPGNLLEISNLTATGNAAITFDLEGKDLFTMGVDSSKQDLFTISKGSDLSDSIFSFSKEKTGVGTDDPKATLHVHGGAGFLITGTGDDSASNLKEEGPGTRLFFYPKKAAFRAGHVDSSQWDDDKIEHIIDIINKIDLGI